MPQNIETSISINASAEKVWRIFTDFKEYPRWNPFLKRVFGKPTQNSSAIVFDFYFKGIFLPAKVIIYTCVFASEISWRGGFPLFLKYLFFGDHRFLFEEVSKNQTLFKHRAVLSGIMPSILKTHIQTAVKNSHLEMNQKLKELSER